MEASFDMMARGVRTAFPEIWGWLTQKWKRHYRKQISRWTGSQSPQLVTLDSAGLLIQSGRKATGWWFPCLAIRTASSHLSILSVKRYTSVWLKLFHNGKLEANFFLLKVWILLGVSFVMVSVLMGLFTWMGARYTAPSGNVEGRRRGDTRASDYVAKYFLYNVNVLTTHGNKFYSAVHF